MRTRLALTVLLGAVALLVLAGCGSEPSASGPVQTVDTSSPAGTPSASSSPSATPASRPAPLPGCQKVWATGKQLPETYQGCQQGTKRVIAHIRCESGQLLYQFHDHYYAVAGGPVIHTGGPLAQDPRYRKTHRSCTG